MKLKTITILFSCLWTVLFMNSACRNDKVECATFQWGYGYLNGPSYWGQCHTGCNGTAQSPIDIKGAVVDGGLTALQLDYLETEFHLLNNGHTVELEYEAGSSLTFEGINYTLKQVHIHGGSEHTINGRRYDLEIHMVHKKSDNEYAVIGLFVEEGAENPFLAGLMDYLPTIEGEHYKDSLAFVNIKDILPTNLGYYNYNGSLTTPPCSEVVNWILLKEPVQASKAQIEKFAAILRTNYRPVQKLKGRTIREF